MPEDVFEKKYLEVWNKMDLLEDQEKFLEQVKQDYANSPPKYPIVMMSCINGTNKDLFMKEVEKLTNEIMGKRPILLKYKYSQHDKVMRWL